MRVEDLRFTSTRGMKHYLLIFKNINEVEFSFFKNFVASPTFVLIGHEDPIVSVFNAAYAGSDCFVTSKNSHICNYF